ncbi:MAG: hypothetical protein JWN79_893 [Gemmatimonadetes bacterium]|jgi:hypothetical protein|nr:hypothetical protein [Gemmatimonadota bacterium]
MPDSNLPQRIDRAAVDRVLARALELQASASGEPQAEQLTEAQLLELAKEVGLDPVNLRQALAEERTRVTVPEERGVLAAMYGPAYVSAQRTVPGTPQQVLKALDDWMQRQEGLCAQRYFSTERVVWEPQQGVVGLVRRAVSGRAHSLARASDVAATAIAVDASRVLVRLDARLLGYRALMAQQNAMLTGASLVGGGILAVLAFPVFAIAAPVAVIAPAAWATARGSHRRTVDRAQIALEQVLDRLERGEAGRPPTLLSMLAAAVRR